MAMRRELISVVLASAVLLRCCALREACCCRFWCMCTAHCETQASSHVYSNTCSTVSQDRRVRSQTEVTEQWRLVVTGPVCPRG